MKQQAKIVNIPIDLYPSLQIRETYLVGPTRLNKGTHYFFYTLNGTFKGGFPVEWVELANSTTLDIESKTNEGVRTNLKGQLEFILL